MQQPGQVAAAAPIYVTASGERVFAAAPSQLPRYYIMAQQPVQTVNAAAPQPAEAEVVAPTRYVYYQ